MNHLGEEKLSAFMEGDLPPEEIREVEGHVKECEQCARALERMRHMVVSLSQLPELAPPADLRVRILERLRRRESWPVQLWRWFTLGWLPIPARVAGTVAVAVLVIGVGLWLSPEQWKQMMETPEVEKISQAGRQGGVSSGPVAEDRNGGGEMPRLGTAKSGRARDAVAGYESYQAGKEKGFRAEEPAGARHNGLRVEDYSDAQRKEEAAPPGSGLGLDGEDEAAVLGFSGDALSAEEPRLLEPPVRSVELGQDLKDEDVRYGEDALKSRERSPAGQFPQVASAVEPAPPEAVTDAERELPSANGSEPVLDRAYWERVALQDRMAKASIEKTLPLGPEGKPLEELPARYVPEQPPLDPIAGTKPEMEGGFTRELLEEQALRDELRRSREMAALAKLPEEAETRESKELLARREQLALEEKADAESIRVTPRMRRDVTETRAAAMESPALDLADLADGTKSSSPVDDAHDKAVDVYGVAPEVSREYRVARGDEADAGMATEGEMRHTIRSRPEPGGEGLPEREKGAETVPRVEHGLDLAGLETDSYRGHFLSETGNGMASFNWQAPATDLRVVRPADLQAGGAAEDFDLIIEADDLVVLEERIDQVAISNGWSVVAEAADTDGDGRMDAGELQEQAELSSSIGDAWVGESFEQDEVLELDDVVVDASEVSGVEETIVADSGRPSEETISGASRVVRLRVPAEARAEAVVQIANLVRPPAEAYFRYGGYGSADGRVEKHFWANRAWVPGESRVLMGGGMYTMCPDAFVADASTATPEWKSVVRDRVAERQTGVVVDQPESANEPLYFSGVPVRAPDLAVRGAGDAGVATVSILLQSIQSPVSEPPAGARPPEVLMEERHQR